MCFFKELQKLLHQIALVMFQIMLLTLYYMKGRIPIRTDILYQVILKKFSSNGKKVISYLRFKPYPANSKSKFKTAAPAKTIKNALCVVKNCKRRQKCYQNILVCT